MTTTIFKSGLQAVISHKGAELISLNNTNSGREYIWEGNRDFWGKHAPVLFPIVGTLKSGSYTFNGKRYELPRHGFAREREFELINQSEDGAVFSLKSDAETLKIYPFGFELQIIYELESSRLNISYKIINSNLISMPFSIGAHPAFALQKEFENYALEFEKQEDLVCFQLEDDLLSEKTNVLSLKNKRLNLSYHLFENDALILKKLESKKISILENNKAILNFRFEDFPHFGIWTKKDAPFICLEPWLGYSDTLQSSGYIEEKEGIQIIEGNTSKTYHYSIEIL